ncbi:recombinase family protein [Clostridium sp. 'deep sea']|uniref:recombinase family protein n=1 Tax=Clostridium sp. 'deep sea' TaxID=2779445 RepID=UPI0018968673|nr:recombinase family protein [Clostridium sp. 'deep sea']QOR36601.1 recombinase family protein [Clostridium sp. 'deep sea']
MKKAALYIRVSTTGQAEEGLSIPAQKKLLKEYALKHDYVISAEHIYIDAGESAKSADRPKFQLMIANAKVKPKPFDAVLVHKTDRFARNRLDSSVYKTLLRKECGIDVISITENFSDDPYGVMMEGIMELFAEFYSLNLSTEVRKGMSEAAGSGIALGRVPFGFVIDPNTNKYVISENQAEIIRYIYELYVKEGYGVDSIHTYLNSKAAEHKFGKSLRVQSSKAQKKIHYFGKKRELKWSAHAIRYILKNDVYTGVFRWKAKDKEEIVIKDNHPAIIAESTFIEAQQLMAKRRTRRNGVAHEYMLRGLVKCAYCGRQMVIFSTKRKDKYYSYVRCSNKNKDSVCHKNGMPLNALQGLVIDNLIPVLDNANLLDKIKIVSNNKLNNEKEINRVKGLLADFNSKFDRQMQAFESGIIDLQQLKHYKEKLQAEKQGLEAELVLLKKQANNSLQINEQEFITQLTNVAKQLKSEDNSEYSKQRALTSIVDKIKVDKFNKSIEIYYKGV